MTPPAPQNRTLTCSPREQATLAQRLLTVDGPVTWEAVRDRVIQQDCLAVAPLLPPACVDLLILDPPYNLAKNYHGHPFRPQSQAAYRSWFGAILAGFQPVLKPTASLYVCADWKTSSLIAPLLEQCFVVRNRITWEREKGRGARSNWKNNSEDIWFCTVSKTYTFNVEAVKLKRKVYAPYRQ
ncbi:MAG: DNA-methyltransferase, partial [Prochlorothrix sp.]